MFSSCGNNKTGSDAVVAAVPPTSGGTTERYRDPNRMTLDEYVFYNNYIYDFLQTIDADKYFAGSHWEKDSRMTVIYLTDLSIVNDSHINNMVRFEYKKYSYAELELFREIVTGEFGGKGWAGTGINSITNKIEIEFIIGTDVSALSGLVPDDAYEYTFVDEYMRLL